MRENSLCASSNPAFAFCTSGTAFTSKAPLVITGYTSLAHTHGAAAVTNLGHEREVATTLLRWFAPQVLFYGLIALATALLNARRRFAAPAWVPVANNLVCVAVYPEAEATCIV